MMKNVEIVNLHVQRPTMCINVQGAWAGSPLHCNPGLTTVLLMCIYRVWWQYNQVVLLWSFWHNGYGQTL